MYRCYNPRKLIALLILDAVAALLCCLFLALGKAVFSDNSEREGVFLPVVMYHSVTRNLESEYQITAAQFEADLRYLAEHGYRTVSVQQLSDYVAGSAALPEKPVMLTFDDGFYNNLTIALPLLEQYDMCAVVNVVGAFTDGETGQEPQADAYSYLSWDNIRTLLDSGRIEIGNHTDNLHSNDTRAGCSIRLGEDAAAYTAMLTEDLHRLQYAMHRETGTMPAAFAYPYGFICKESVPVLRELGFVCSFTCYERPNYITHDPDCLLGLDRYNRDGRLGTEAFFSRVLS